KRLNRPLAELFGGAVRQHLPVLWTLASGDTDRDIDEARTLIAARRHCDFKLKIGSRPLMDDVRHVAAIKAAVGDEASVRVDVNQAWDESTAARGMAELQAAGIDLVEQPTPMKDFAALARLSAKFHIPILADEAVADATDMYKLAAEGFSGAVAMKIAKAGGPLRALEQAAVAQAAGVGLYGGTLLEGTIGTAASLHAWATLDHLQWGTEMFGPLLMKDDIVVQPLKYHENGVDLPTGPGLGAEVGEDKLAEYRRTYGEILMLVNVEMKASIPHDIDADVINEIKAREKAYAQHLQRQGKWRHLWRVAGSYANVSIFDVADNAELQDLISNLPLFPYMDITVAPLCR